jgi:hypothetical protein
MSAPDRDVEFVPDGSGRPRAAGPPDASAVRFSQCSGPSSVDCTIDRSRQMLTFSARLRMSHSSLKRAQEPDGRGRLVRVGRVGDLTVDATDRGTPATKRAQ